ncbi:MAG TPA: hypothetical protein VKD26_02190 [Streptosporangiaceae bacterium]|nr:hypothetical protein [Streptosporangiaceae bacterium]
MDRDPNNPHPADGPAAAGAFVPGVAGQPSRRQVLRGAGAGAVSTS